MIRWVFKKFIELSPEELYAILQLRNEVFVVEQNCVFQDADDKDQSSVHLMGWREKKLVAYTRIVPPGQSYKEPSIGRVVTAQQERGKGTGHELMKFSISKIHELYSQADIKIGAQLYLKKFYESLGFLQSSEVYPEDGIDHIEMTRITHKDA
ncbi:MAG: GNAT family N-acetyltransferase [Chitinophagaceae bacterium]|jgi:ElaA protein|nr:GNAT family N-acetyltransferase [Chitinophagaceae bacterium]